MKLFGSIRELVAAVFRKDSQAITLEPYSGVGFSYTNNRTVKLPAKDGDAVLVSSGDIDNDDIAAGAGIVDTKLATISTAGKVSNSATTATDANTASAIVARDGSGNFSAGTITASLSGNVTGNVSGSAASFTGSLSGEVTGTQSATVVADDVIDNANIKSTAAIAYSKLNLASSIVNADIASAAAIADTKLATISTAGKVANSATTATSSATPSTIVSRDGAGATNLSALGVAGNLTTANLEATGQSLLQFAYINGTAGMGFVELEGQSSTPAAPTTGEARLFAGTDGKIYVRKAGSASAEELGASGSGEVNLVDTPSDAGQWTGVNATVTTNTTAANNPLAGVIDSSISIASSTLNGYARTRFTMPSALKNRKLKLEWFQIAASLASGAYKVEVYTNASSDYSGAYTELALSTDSSGTSSIPNLNGKYSTTFDTNGSDYYEIRIVRTAASSATLYVANVVCGPGIQPQGAVVGEWQSYTDTVANGGTAVFTYTSRQWRRVGDSIEIMYDFSVTTAGSGSSIVLIPLPAGLSIDTTKAPNGDLNLGHFSRYNGSTNTAESSVRYVAATSTTALALQKTGGTGVYLGSDLALNTVWYVKAVVPIAQWAGSGTVQLAQNDVEYAYSTDATTTAGNTQTDNGLYGYGPGGTNIVGIGSNTLASFTSKRVRFQSPIQQGDFIRVEVNQGGANDPWIPIEELGLNCLFQARARFGIQWQRVSGSTTDILVQFGNGGATPASGTTQTYETINLDPWSGYTAYKWRVRKSSAGAAVGFGIADASSAGLVNPYTVGSGVVYAGTYTPTITNYNGVTVGTVYTAQYLRIGRVVTVSGTTISGLTGSTNVSFLISVPIARISNFGHGNAGGTAVYGRGGVGTVPMAAQHTSNLGAPASNTSIAFFGVTGSATYTADTISYQFTYVLDF